MTLHEHARLNAARITFDLALCPWVGCTFDILERVSAAALALAKIESRPGFDWEEFNRNWDDVCHYISHTISYDFDKEPKHEWATDLGRYLKVIKDCGP